VTPGIDEPIIRTRRIEVVDGDGRTRAVVGDLSGAAQPEAVFGVALVDRSGRHRVWLSLDDNGAALGFDRAGNAVLELGVDDGGESVRTGAYIQLSDLEGRPSLGWRVDDDGAVVLRVAGRAP